MEAPEPKAQGTLSKTPFSNLLLYALNNQLTGTMEFVPPNAAGVTVSFVNGLPVKARTEGLHFLGEMMIELGIVNDEQHQLALTQQQVDGSLYGQILQNQGVITEEQLIEGLGAQLARKLEIIFSFNGETTFAFYEAYDALADFGGPEVPQIDPFAVIWSGIRANPQWEHVHETLTRIGNAGVKLAPHAAPDRFPLGKGERAAIEMLRAKPHRVVDLSQQKIVGPTSAQLLVYCLLITKQVELVEAPPSVRPPAMPPAAPAPHAPPTPAAIAPFLPASPASPVTQAAQAAPPPNAFGKVQLSRMQVGGGIAETVGATSARDPRVATPYPGTPVQAPPARAIAPPPPSQPRPFSNTGKVPIVPPAAASAPKIASASSSSSHASAGNVPAAPKSGPAVHIPPEKRAEYELMKKKIVDRAEKIGGQNYFEMLGVSQAAKPDEIQKAFFALAKEWHPDRLPAALGEVRDACNKVFSHMSEASQTLSDQKRRQEYMTLLKDGGATPQDQEKIQAILEAATNFSKAEFYLKQNKVGQAEEFCRKAWEADPEQADYIAMLAWLESQKPQNQDKDQTRARIAMLDKAIKINENCEKAYFYRGMLHKRMDNPLAAVKDFKNAADINPRNLDAMREVRLYQMRKNNPTASSGGSMPPPGASSPPGRSSMPPKHPANKSASETVGSLFGKLFKK